MSDKPVLHYLDIGRLGRGEVVRLFLRDAGIEFEDVRYPFDGSWAATSAWLREKGISRTGKVPALEYHGTILTEHIPILRYLARELGEYDGRTSPEKYIVDAVADIYIDWRAQWVANLTNATDDYKNNYAPDYYNILSQYYSDRGVYQSIDNDERTGTLPARLPETLKKFREAFESRPRVKEYLHAS